MTGHSSMFGGLVAAAIACSMSSDVQIVERMTAADVRCMAVSPDGLSIALGGQNGVVTVLDAGTGKETHSIKSHKDAVTALAFSPDSATLAAGSEGKVKEETVKLWNLKESAVRRFRQISPHTSEILCIAFSPDGNTLAIAGKSKTVGIFDLARGSHREWLKGHNEPIRSIAFTAEGKSLVSWSEDGVAKIWDIPTD